MSFYAKCGLNQQSSQNDKLDLSKHSIDEQYVYTPRPTVPQLDTRVLAKDCILTDRRPSDEEKKSAIAAASIRRTGMARIGAGKSRQNTISTIINFTTFFSTTAGVDNATVISLIPSGSPEFTSFASLWDEIIVDSGHIDFTSSIVTNFTTNSGAARAVVAFDPIEGVALGSLSNALQHSQHFQFQPAQGGGTLTNPQAHTPNGIFRFHWRTPRGPARVSGTPSIFGHDWSSTTDTSSCYGFLKWYIPNSGNTGVILVYYTWTLNVRFRSRT